MDHKNLHEIWLAGGCFWGLEAYLLKIKGIVATNVGYGNGNTQHPSYKQVCYENTGHAEMVYVQYDSEKISLLALLNYYFKVIDPLSVNRQGNDIGSQYRTGIYYKAVEDKAIIDRVIAQEQGKYAARIVTEVLPIANYYVAEEEHQKYLLKNPQGYCHINLALLDEEH